MSQAWRKAYELIVTEDEGRICRDIPESACAEQPGNFFKHALSLAATKTGDGLADPKLVLSWLLTTLGAPAYLIGLLVPVREAGSLLPQLVIAGRIRRMPQRKWAWVMGSLVQAVAVAGMTVAALLLPGAAAGATIVTLLAVFALARSVCSVSYKDVLGKTVSKSTRGTATGTAATLAATFVFTFGLLLSFSIIPKSVSAIAVVLLVAAGLWLIAAGIFATLAEDRGATEGGGNPIDVVREQIALLSRDAQLVRFIAARGLLTATALAPPYILAISGSRGGSGLGDLGLFVIASATAGMGSTYLWGRMSDRSSRRVLMAVSVIAAVVFALTALLNAMSVSAAVIRWGLPALLFVLMIAYQGVRIARSTHLVDMATIDTRAAYTALSNTIVGGLLLLGGLFGALAQQWGYTTVMIAFAVMCAAVFFIAAGLEEVQQKS